MHGDVSAGANRANAPYRDRPLPAGVTLTDGAALKAGTSTRVSGQRTPVGRCVLFGFGPAALPSVSSPKTTTKSDEAALLGLKSHFPASLHRTSPCRPPRERRSVKMRLWRVTARKRNTIYERKSLPHQSLFPATIQDGRHLFANQRGCWDAFPL